MKKKFYTKNQGFTLIELLVSITIFVLVVAAAIGIFVSSLQGKQRVNQLKEIEDNARYAMELMSREIRMAQGIAGDEAGTANSEIDFSSVKFCRANSGGNCDSNGNYLARNNNLVTSNRIKINNLIFYVNDFSTDVDQPRVTISMTVASSDDSVKMNFQTTISPRIY